AALLGGLTPKAAACFCSILTQTMAKTTKPYDLLVLADGLAAVAHRVDRDEAARFCSLATATLSHTMAKTPGRYDLLQLAKGLAVMAGGVEPKEPAAILFQAMAKTTDSFVLRELAQLLAAVAGRLEPKEASQAAATLSRTMATATDLNAQYYLAR